MIASHEPRNIAVARAPQPAPIVNKYDNRRIEVHVDAKGADADEVARKLEQRLQWEALASCE